MQHWIAREFSEMQAHEQVSKMNIKTTVAGFLGIDVLL